MTEQHRSKLVPVILSGGAGTRLWPASRRSHPKPFLEMPDGETLIEKTLARALRLTDDGIMTVTGRDHHLLTRETYLRAGADGERLHYLLEPVGRNTAAAAAMAAMYARDTWGGDTVLLVMPADQLIEDVDAFAAAVDKARALANEGYLVTFGIEPDRPETGYGYIRRGAPTGGGYIVDRFVEKPDLDTAASYLASGEYLWNAGIFCFTAERALESLAEHAPEVHERALACWNDVAGGTGVVELPQGLFAAIPSISIDYAVMEKSRRAAVVPCNIGWNDVGSWKTLSELGQPDEDDNRTRGEVVIVDSRNCYVQSRGRPVAVVGVDNLAIVDTGDAVLVTHLDRAQQVKAVVDALKSQDHPVATEHPVETHPWGRAELIDRTGDCRIRRLHLRAGAILEESDGAARHWTLLEGTIEAGNQTLESGAHLGSPAGERATLKATTDTILIEVEKKHPEM